MPKSLTRATLTALILITLAALLLRLYALDAVRFNIDHAYPIWQALRTLHYGEWPLVGQATSVLFANPALTGYLYLPPLMLWPSPLAVYGWVVALNTLAIPFTFHTARALLKRDALALIAATLMAFNPWVIEYSRTTWVQSLMPFFVTLITALIVPLWLGTAQRRGVRTLAALVTATLFTQTYLLAFWVVIPMGLLSLIFWRRMAWRWVAAGVLLFTLASAAYGLTLLQNPNANLNRTSEFAAKPASLSGEALSHALRLVTGDGYTLARSATRPDAATRQPLEWGAHLALTTALIIGGVFAARAWVSRAPMRDSALIVLVWWALPVLAMSYTSNPVHPFYQLPGLPMGAILVAWGLAPLTQARAGRVAVAGALIVWAGLMGVNFIRSTDENLHTPAAEGLAALPLRDGLRVGAAIREGLPPQGIVYANVNEWILNGLAGRLFTVIGGVQSARLTIIPYSGGLYIQAVPPARNGLGLYHSQPYAEYPLADATRVLVRRFKAGRVLLDARTRILTVTADNGLTLIGYQRRTLENGQHELVTFWRVDSVTAETGQAFYGAFAHVFDDSGTRVAVADGVPVSGLLWNQGDVFVQRMRYDAPPQHSLAVGQYDINGQRNALFTLADGTQEALVPLE